MVTRSESKSDSNVTDVESQKATFGAMLASGVRAGREAIALFDSYDIVDGEVIGLKQ